MATEILNDRDAFNRYLDERYGGNMNGHTLEKALAEFRKYQEQLLSVQTKVLRSIEASDCGESKPLDDDEFWSSANARMDAKGIPE